MTERQQVVLRVFVSSPSDVAPERQGVKEVIDLINKAWSAYFSIRFEDIRWETDASPGVGDDPQQVIDAQIADDYDLFVGIMWHRFGTPTSKAESGTVDEFERAMARYSADPSSVQIMFYFKEGNVQLQDIDGDQLSKVKAFQASLGKRGVLWYPFSQTDQFAYLLHLHLARRLQEFVGQNEVKLEPQSINDREPIDSLSEIMRLVFVMQERLTANGKVLRRMTNAAGDYSESLDPLRNEIRSLRDALRMVDSQEWLEELSEVANRAVADMDTLSSRTKAEIPNFRRLLKEALQALQALVPRVVGLGTRQEISQFASKTLGILNNIRGMVLDAKEFFLYFRTTTQSIPPLTVGMEESKLRLDDTLNDLVVELSIGDTLIEATVNLLSSLEPDD